MRFIWFQFINDLEARVQGRIGQLADTLQYYSNEINKVGEDVGFVWVGIKIVSQLQWEQIPGTVSRDTFSKFIFKDIEWVLPLYLWIRISAAVVSECIEREDGVGYGTWRDDTKTACLVNVKDEESHELLPAD